MRNHSVSKSAETSKRLMERGHIAATPMKNWGSERSDRFVRLVFSNEPVARLRGLRERVERALGRFPKTPHAKERTA